MDASRLLPLCFRRGIHVFRHSSVPCPRGRQKFSRLPPPPFQVLNTAVRSDGLTRRATPAEQLTPPFSRLDSNRPLCFASIIHHPPPPKRGSPFSLSLSQAFDRHALVDPPPHPPLRRVLRFGFSHRRRAADVGEQQRRKTCYPETTGQLQGYREEDAGGA